METIAINRNWIEKGVQSVTSLREIKYFVNWDTRILIFADLSLAHTLGHKAQQQKMETHKVIKPQLFHTKLSCNRN